MKRICVFCGSSAGSRPVYADVARKIGASIAARGLELIYGGGNIGLMGAVADAALEAGGKVVGVIPYALMAREVGHLQLTELHIVDSMHERKAMMADLSDGFVALPGGFGTFEEIFEIITWAQLGMHAKPCAFLNTNGFYDGMIRMIDHAVAEEFIRPKYRPLVLVGNETEQILNQMQAYQPPELEKWIERQES